MGHEAIRWLGVLALCGGGLAASNGSVARASNPSPASPHIMLIVDENQEYRHIIGDSTDAPYINNLAATYTSATNWCSVEHNSPTDHLDLISGSDQDLPNKKPPFSATTIVDELHGASIPWQAYMESMPSACSTVQSTSDGLYDHNHNPFSYLGSYSSYCSSDPSQGVEPYPGASTLVNTLERGQPTRLRHGRPQRVRRHARRGQQLHRGHAEPAHLRRRHVAPEQPGPNPHLQLVPEQRRCHLHLGRGGHHAGRRTPPDNGSCGPTATTGCGGHVATLVITPYSSGAFTGQGDLYGILRATEEAYGVGLLGHSSGTADGDLSPAFTSLTGTVTDTSTNNPIASATVTCTCATGSATTNGTGQYSFSGLTAGSYSLTVSPIPPTRPAPSRSPWPTGRTTRSTWR